MSRTTNFRSYDAQARLLAALVASLENQRFDFKSKFTSNLVCFIPSIVQTYGHQPVAWGARLPKTHLSLSTTLRA